MLLDNGTRARLADVQSAIADMRDYLCQIAAQLGSEAPAREDQAPIRVTLSSMAPSASWQTTDVCNIIGVIVGGDTNGRGKLQIGNDTASNIFWVQAGISRLYDFGWPLRLTVARGQQITWSPPANTTAWDVTLIYVPTDMDAPRSR